MLLVILMDVVLVLGGLFVALMAAYLADLQGGERKGKEDCVFYPEKVELKAVR